VTNPASATAGVEARKIVKPLLERNRFIVWAVILAVVADEAIKDTAQTFLLLFSGWVIGWLSATIARSVYPPPKWWWPVDKAP